MGCDMADQALIRQDVNSITQAIAPAISLWADHTTDPASQRRADLLRDKANAVLDFLTFTDKGPGEITPLDVKTWQAELEAQELAASTVYAKISRVSSFYGWAIDNGLAQHNPVVLARPKAPKAYQNESAQGLTDQEVINLLDVVRSRGSVTGQRDYALLLFYFFTGKRRSEIISLQRRDIKVNGTLVITSKVKGGDYESYEVAHPHAKQALMAYIEASGRNWTDMQPDEPIWLAHDRSGQNTGQAVSSHGFVKNLKRYAKEAGLDHIHLHQTRHTAAGWADSVNEAQELLGHKHQSTTRIYKRRVSVKEDKFSAKVANRLGL